MGISFGGGGGTLFYLPRLLEWEEVPPLLLQSCASLASVALVPWCQNRPSSTLTMSSLGAGTGSCSSVCSPHPSQDPVYSRVGAWKYSVSEIEKGVGKRREREEGKEAEGRKIQRQVQGLKKEEVSALGSSGKR